MKLHAKKNKGEDNTDKTKSTIKKKRFKKNCIGCKKIFYGKHLCYSCHLTAYNMSTTYNCVCSSGYWCDYCYGEIDLYD